MIISQYELDERQKHLKDLSVQEFEYFLVKYDADDTKVCGLPAFVAREEIDPLLQNFPVFQGDLAFRSEVPGFYFLVQNLFLRAFVIIDAQGRETAGLCRAVDFETIQTTLNMKYKPDLPPEKPTRGLTLVKS